MIIQILSSLFDEGYIKKEGDSMVSPFFSGSNVAFRRKIFKEIGLYDTNCATGEDQDMSIRAAQAGWELYFQPRAIVGHRCRKSLRQFMKQWFKYGLHHPYVFKKHNKDDVTLYIKNKASKKGALYKCIFRKKKFPLHANVFMGPFFLMNVFLFMTLITVLNHLDLLAIILGVITLLIGFYYFRSDIEGITPLRTIQFIFLRYLANASLFMGGLLGGLKLKTLYISSTLDYKQK
jgi:cellulose synthase/poly-beta-1,6-N-acetylglucosamine synthase-like glycosyltransferase